MNSYDMSRTSRLTAERPGQVPPSRHPGGAARLPRRRLLGAGIAIVLEATVAAAALAAAARRQRSSVPNLHMGRKP